jgi:hypothetical protein
VPLGAVINEFQQRDLRRVVYLEPVALAEGPGHAQTHLGDLIVLPS